MRKKKKILKKILTLVGGTSFNGLVSLILSENPMNYFS